MYLVTGVTGFIGSHIASALLDENKEVLGLSIQEQDSSDWIRQARLKKLLAHKGFTFSPCDITDKNRLAAVLQPYAERITHVVQLAAQTGIRDSLVRAHSCAERNILGHLNMLEIFRTFKNRKHFLYASSSSVYGLQKSLPFKETDNTDYPLSIYAATKKSAEVITESYARLYDIHATGLRFFTVYGPWGRPDMAYFSFARNISAGKPIVLYNHGEMGRDFTFISDIVNGIMKLLARNPDGNASHTLYNLGSGYSETLDTLLQCLETEFGKKAIRQYADMQPGEMKETWADISRAKASLGFEPQVRLPEGIRRFVQWYKDHVHD